MEAQKPVMLSELVEILSKKLEEKDVREKIESILRSEK